MKRSVLIVFSIIMLCSLFLMPTALVNASADVPDDWELETGVYATIPEALTIVAVVLLSSVAVAVSFYCLRKRSKTESYSSAKTGIKPTR